MRIITVPTLATSKLLANQRAKGSSGSAKILSKFASVGGMGIQRMGKTNWLASVVKAIENMYSSGMMMMKARGSKTSHIRIARFVSLLIPRLPCGRLAVVVAAMINNFLLVA